LDLVAVLDKSGSMVGEKLALMKKTMNFIVDQLTIEDRLSIVTYSDAAVTHFELKHMAKVSVILYSNNTIARNKQKTQLLL
jgi:secreted protein with Ig-like and vWFA domain